VIKYVHKPHLTISLRKLRLSGLAIGIDFLGYLKKAFGLLSDRSQMCWVQWYYLD
jgi:hypothetical protein